MSYPAPPGLTSNSTKLHDSLPARPPPSTANPAPAFKPPSHGDVTKPAFTAFAPRQVASTAAFRTNSPAHYSAAPVTSYSSGPQYTQPQADYQAQPQYADQYSQAPQIRNPFIPTAAASSNSSSAPASAYDPEYEAQVQQWQSAYVSKDDKFGYRPSGVAVVTTSAPTRPDTSSPANVAISSHSTSKSDSSTSAQKTVQRTGGGTSWTDSTLLEWDPAHFRIFVGNLAGEVTDDSLLKAFSKYPSVQKARVVRDKRSTKSRGYGFVSFSGGDDYFRAAREMQGKYIGSHPVLIKRAMTEVKPSTVAQQQHGKKGKNGAGGYNGGHGKTEYGGVQKKLPKTKGGLKVLG